MSNKLRKNLSVIMAVVMIFSVFTQTGVVASAEETSVLTFTVKDGKATISKADANATVIEIPAEYEGVPVVGVEQVAFLSCSKITEFIVDENSEYFSTDEYGVLYNKDKTKLVKFINGSDLTEFDIPESVVELGFYAFRMSKKLVRVYIPGSISEIGIDCFYDCNNLSDIIFSEGLTKIGELAFGFCTALTTINLPDSLKSVGLGAFAGCNLTGKLKLPDSLYCINSSLTWSDTFAGPITEYSVSEENDYLSVDQNGILYNKDKSVLLSVPRASSLKEYRVPKSVVEISTGAFNCVSALNTIICHDEITKIGKSAFNHSGITSFSFPKGVTTVPKRVFYGCAVLKEVFLHDSISLIEEEAFWYCEMLDSIEIPNSVSSIADRAFYVSSIKNIVIPSSITVINNSVFGGCENLTDVYYAGTADEWDSLTVADGNEYLLNATIHYNYGRTQGTLGDSLSWNFDKNTNTLCISGDGEMVSYESFGEYPWYAYRDEIKFVEIEDGVLSVGDNAFSGCLALKEVFLGASTGKIGESTFADCASLSVVTVCAQTLNVQNTSFTEFNDRFVLLHNSSNLQAEEFAIANDINAIPFSYDNTKNVLEFSGEFMVYEDVDYNLLTQLIKRYSDTKYLFFEKLVFDGVTTKMIEIDDLGNVITDEEYLSFKNIYISISAVKGEGEEGITFARLIEMLENGNHEGFIIEIESEDGKERLDFEQVWNDFVDFVLKAASKLINWFSKLFKRK